MPRLKQMSKAVSLVLAGICVFGIARYAADAVSTLFPAYAYLIEKAILAACVLVILFLVVSPLFKLLVPDRVERKRVSAGVEDV